jgi:hypothetical protein
MATDTPVASPESAPHDLTLRPHEVPAGAWVRAFDRDSEEPLRDADGNLSPLLVSRELRLSRDTQLCVDLGFRPSGEAASIGFSTGNCPVDIVFRPAETFTVESAPFGRACAVFVAGNRFGYSWGGRFTVTREESGFWANGTEQVGLPDSAVLIPVA